MKTIEQVNCPITYILALNDALNAVSGKWKLAVVSSLLFNKRRFNEIQRNIKGITPRMLSKELRDLEANGIVKRRVYDSTPVVVEYELTESGKRLSLVIDQMYDWGVQHRKLTLAS